LSTKMAAEFETLVNILLFSFYIYLPTSPEVQPQVQNLSPPNEFRISASLVEISFYRANYL